jgi:hypothetical protein
MAIFRVGQKVRIVKTLGGGLLGAEATVVALDVRAISKLRGPYVGHRLDIINVYGAVCVAPPDCIEPVVELGSWDALRELGLDPERLLEIVEDQQMKKKNKMDIDWVPLTQWREHGDWTS